MPKLTELRVYDSSREADTQPGVRPEPALILHLVRARIVDSCNSSILPNWPGPFLCERWDQRDSAAGFRLTTVNDRHAELPAASKTRITTLFVPTSRGTLAVQ